MDTKKLKYLLVDDDPLIRDIYSVKFSDAGLDFHQLSNVDGDFLKKVIEINPSVILMDIQLGGSGGNGVTAGEELSQSEQTKSIPIIFFTNADIEELVKRAQKLSSTIGFLIKSQYAPDEMISKVQELYNLHLEHNNK
jgi:CheY-like chemotaxis protein